MSGVTRKLGFRVSDQDRHKLGCKQGCHTSGKSHSNLNFERSGNFANCPGNLKLLVNAREF